MLPTGAHAFLTLNELLATAGFAPVDLPILQPAAIFLEVSGEELRRRLYLTSDPEGNELCLRPDLTIPTARRHIAGGDPYRAARYSYLGPVFRYRADGPSEFLQAGAESFGFAEPEAEEAATLALAFDAAAALGQRDPEVRIGDVGLLDALVSALDLSAAARRTLHRDLSSERPPGSGLARSLKGGAPERLSALLRLGPEEARRVTRELLALTGVQEIAGRTVDEIAERFLEQASLSAGQHLGQEVRRIVERFLTISGAPREVAAALRRFAADTQVEIGPALDRFERRLEAFSARAIAVGRLKAATAFGRNLDYYTGLVFEFADPARPELGQLIAGGRYDRLLASLGAPGDVPAVGFSIWLGRFAETGA